jgi:Flagellar hook capping protein
MSSDSVSSADSINYASTAGTKSKSGPTIDTNTFLKLLVAQLQYQDPLEPQTDTSFVTQLSQMTSLEQMQQMNASISNSQAYDMLGKNVCAKVIDSTTGVTNCYQGTVDSVIIKDGIPYVVIGNVAVPVSDVLQVNENPAPTTEPESGTGEPVVNV